MELCLLGAERRLRLAQMLSETARLGLGPSTTHPCNLPHSPQNKVAMWIR